MNPELTKKFSEKALEYLLETPALIAMLVLCFISGHLVFFVVFTFTKDKDATKTYLNTSLGKVGLGALMYSLVALPIYFIKYKTLLVKYQNLLEIIPTTIIMGLVLQAVAFSIFLYRRKGVAA